jgi:hypothetical protein
MFTIILPPDIAERDVRFQSQHFPVHSDLERFVAGIKKPQRLGFERLELANIGQGNPEAEGHLQHVGDEIAKESYIRQNVASSTCV